MCKSFGSNFEGLCICGHAQVSTRFLLGLKFRKVVCGKVDAISFVREMKSVAVGLLFVSMLVVASPQGIILFLTYDKEFGGRLCSMQTVG